ncbi:MAG: SpoIIE family protein phosphatase [Putridiphycobacter sp.]
MVLIFSANFAFSQTDSLFKVLNKAESRFQKVKVLNLIGDALVDRSVDSADLYYNQGLQIVNQLLIEGNSNQDSLYSEKSKLLSGLGYVSYLNYNYREAISRLEEGIDLRKEIYGQNIVGIKHYYKHLSLCYYNLGDFKSSMDYLFKSIEENDDGENEEFFNAQIYFYLGKNYHKIKSLNNSQKYFSMAVGLARKLNREILLAYSLNGLGETYLDLDELKKAEEILWESENILLKNNSDAIVETYAVLAGVKLKRNDLDSALYFLQSAEKLSFEYNNEYDRVKVYTQYAAYKIQEKNYDEAIYYAKELLELGEEKNDISVKVGAYDLLQNLYEWKGEYLRAYDYSKLYNQFKDSLSLEEARSIVLKQEISLQQKQKAFQDSIRFSVYNQQKENELKLHKLNSEKNESRNRWLFFSVLGLVLTIFVVLRSFLIKRKDNETILKKAQEVEEQKALLASQNEKLKSEAVLYKILQICSSDQSLNTIFKDVLDELISSDLSGQNSRAFISLNENPEVWNVDVENGLTREKQEKIKNLPFKNCICGNEYMDNKVEFCNNGVFSNHFNVPILNNNKFLGVLIVFTDFEVSKMVQLKGFLNSVGFILGQTIERYYISDKLRFAHIENTIKKKEVERANKKVNQALKKQEAVNDLMNSIIRNENVGDKVFQYVTDIFNNEFIKRLNITLFDFEKNKVRYYFLRENGVEKPSGKDFSLSKFSTETLETLKQNKRMVVKSIRDREVKSETDMEMLKNNVNSFVSFPLFMDNKLLGSLNISFDQELKFTQEQEEFLEMLIESVTISIHQTMLFNEIKQKNFSLSELNTEINSSINYAKKLQAAVLPTDDYLDNIIRNRFIILNQRDTVGGDFYWVRAYEEEGIYVIANIDCTGHSVPGAFMTMLSRVLLREAFTIMGLRKPNEVLAQMDRAVRRIFKQDDYSAMQDGMDMSIVVIDVKSGEFSFSSAQRPIALKLIESNKVEYYKGSKFPVGGYYEREKKFEVLNFKYHEVDSFYLFSDGFTDQFGGENIKKYGSKKFLDTLDLINALPMTQQKEFLLNEFKNWKGELDQIDDVSVIGVRLDHDF